MPAHTLAGTYSLLEESDPAVTLDAAVALVHLGGPDVERQLIELARGAA